MSIKDLLAENGAPLRGPQGSLAVQWSPDWERIRQLPRRDEVHALPNGIWPGDKEPRPDLNAKFKKPGGKMDLFPDQVQALHEIGLAAGGAVFLAVGAGKTLVALLAGQMLNAKRVMYFTLASARDQVERYDIPEYSQHFNIRTDNLSVHSHDELSSRNGATLLERCAPDVVVIDEAHKFRHKHATRTKRLLRFLRDHPNVVLVWLSGTATNASLKDYQHLLTRSHHERAPIPAEWPALLEWDQAIAPVRQGKPREAGVLDALCRVGETVRDGYRRRLLDTVGVIGSSSRAEALGSSLYFHRADPVVPPVVAAALRDLEATWARPDGETFADILSMHRARRQLSQGFYYRWVWPNGTPTPQEQAWLDARKTWYALLREELKGLGRPGMDSPWFLAAAAERGLAKFEGRLHPSQAHLPIWQTRDHKPIPEWVEWRKYKDMPPPPREAVWLDSYVVEAAVAWAHEHPTGILWTQHEALGNAIAMVGKLPYFGGGEEASKGIKDLQAKLKAEGRHQAVVASLQAHGTAKNLQLAWNEQLFVEIPANGTVIEQAVGRVHRTGQEADEVNVYAFLHTRPLEEAFCAALLQSDYIQATTGQRQKLVYGTKTFRVNSAKFDRKLLELLWRQG